MLAGSAAGAGAIVAAGALGRSPGTAQAAARRRRGYLVGFTSLEKEVRLPALTVEGDMPDWLQGVLVRNGPAKFEVGDKAFNHWFDGLAMLHAFAFARGRVSYANRFLRTDPYFAWKRENRIKFSEFATDPCRQIFSGVVSPPTVGRLPNANVSVTRLARDFVALTEISQPIRFNPRTLRTLGVGPDVPLGRMGTAHPHRDLQTGEAFTYETDLATPPYGTRVLVTRGGRRRELAFLPAPEPGYMHSFALTPRYVVLFQQPWVINPLDLLKPDRGTIAETFRWEGSRPSRVVVIDRRRGGVVSTSELDPFFVFHHINAFERGNRLHLDVCAHPDARVVDALYLKRLRQANTHLPQATAKRLEVDPSRNRTTVHELADVPIELPRTNYGRYNQRPYRYAYGVGTRGPRSAFVDQLVKLNVRNDGVKIWREADAYPGEPVFVPAPRPRTEDDGVVLSVVLDGRRRTSYLLVLDGRTFTERARAAVPHHIPHGFHGEHFVV
jgi:beta,beta-carotene 9',10'-dioxygenase